MIVLPLVLDGYLLWEINILFNIFWMLYFTHTISIGIFLYNNKGSNWENTIEEIIWLFGFFLLTILIFIEIIGKSLFGGNWIYTLIPLYLILIGLIIILLPIR